MKKAPFIVCLIFLVVLSVSGQTGSIELRDNFFYIDGQKTFLKGINYETGAIPGQNPWDRSLDRELIEFDMNRILSAGFNTIRTWGMTTEEELEVLKDFDIKILMGIWIGNGSDFSDPDFIELAKSNVSYVLSYSKNYDNIIGYLIQNEPLPEEIFTSGYAETQYLWHSLAEIIHAGHPGRPVSISNTCVGSYIDPDLFDISAYNVYPYNPSTVNHSHGYAAYIEFLRGLTRDGIPLIITEYGLPVSPAGPGNWGYGGNSLQEQEDAILYMYSSLLDGGASGSNIFIYSDGWWKNGDPTIHDNSPEEWFGLVNYTGLSDKYGEERPAWEAVKEYQYAIIASPRNSTIYSDKVFVEVFSEDIADSVKVFHGENIVYKNGIQNNYLADTIILPVTGCQDYVLHFEFYDAATTLVKEEDINCLVTNEPVTLPSIEITTDPGTFSGAGNMSVTFNVTNNPVFSNSGKLEYVFYPHQGWDYGDTLSEAMSFAGDQFELSRDFSVSDLSYVISFAAGFDITYGSFTKRIHASKTLIREDVNVALQDNTIGNKNFIIYPNPSSGYIRIRETDLSENHRYGYKIIDLQGKLILSGQTAANDAVDVQQLDKGYYIVIIENKDHRHFYEEFIKK
ncbi:MAG: T9SS type A sorting domain-containing protein [Bacteroidales bacterium]|jgi:hypothetical protein